MPRPKLGNVRINLLIQPKVLAALRKLANIKGTTYSELLRTAAEQYVRQEVAALRAARAEQYNSEQHNSHDSRETPQEAA